MPAKAVSYTRFSDNLTNSLNDITRMINEHKDMIDAIQGVAIDLTDAMSTLLTLTVKYAGITNAILDSLLPIAKGLPIIPKKVTDLLVNLEAITQKILDNSQVTSKTITDVNVGLKTGDASKLKGQTTQLQSVIKNLSAILPK
jgi:hypothetical protein